MKTKFTDLNSVKKQKVYDLIAPNLGWTAQVQNGVDANFVPIMIPNPETSAQFYERVKDEGRVDEYLITRAALKAQQASQADINSGI